MTQLIVSGSNDRTVRLWDKKTGLPIKHFSTTTSKIYCVTISYLKDKIYLIVGGSDKIIRIYDVYSGLLLNMLSGHENDVRSLAVLDEGKKIVSAGYDKKIIVWDMESGKRIKTLKGHKFGIHSIALSDNKKILASAGIEKDIFLWDMDTGKIIKKLRGHRETVTDLKFTFDLNYLISGSEDRSIKIWDVKTGNLVRTIVDPDSFGDFAENVLILKDKDYLVSGGRDSILRIWDYKTGKQIGLLKGHYDEIRCIAILPGEKFIVSGSDDGTVRIFDIGTMEEVQVLEGHSSFVTSCSIISEYDSSKEENTLEIQHKMLEGNFPDYYTYSRAMQKGLMSFEDYTSSIKVKLSSRRKAKGKIISNTELIELTESSLDNIIKSILQKIKTYKTLSSIEKEFYKGLKKQSFEIPKNIQELLSKKLNYFESQGLIELSTRGKSMIVKKKSL